MPLGKQNIDLKASLKALEGGGLPIRAQLRLREEAGANRKLFTSDLSVSEFLLTREVDAQPISQVMGSSVYHIGRIPDYKGATGEVAQLSGAHRTARRLAMQRIYLEGKAVGADAIVGVRLGERLITRGAHGKGGDDGDELIEFSMVGTAIRAPWMPRSEHGPVVTDLSGQDMWSLHRNGYAPTGLVFDFCRYHVWHVMKQGFWTSGGEVTSARDAVDTARAVVHDRVMKQATATGAEFVVGSDLTVKVREVPCGYENCALNDLDIDVAWFGTGIRRAGEATVSQDVPPLILSMMPLGRKRSDQLLAGESESDRLAREAAEEEKRAAERE
jgi:uncharacterized protein YbjQ (UPF0145 family)